MKDTIRIAVLVSGCGTNLQALIDAAQAGQLPSGRLSLIVSTKPGAYALTRARIAGIPTEVIEQTADFEGALSETLRAYGIELIVLAGFMKILSPQFVGAWSNRIINVHPSLIPSFCGKGFYGLRVHEAALSYGVKLTGATVHFVNEVPDGGEIIAQKAVPVFPDDTPELLQRRVMEQAEWIILPAATEAVASAQLAERGAEYEKTV